MQLLTRAPDVSLFIFIYLNFCGTYSEEQLRRTGAYDFTVFFLIFFTAAGNDISIVLFGLLLLNSASTGEFFMWSCHQQRCLAKNFIWKTALIPMLSKTILFTMNQHDIHSRSLRLLSSKYMPQQQQWCGLHGSILIHWVCQQERDDESLMDRSENSEVLHWLL